jgi:hypothetical protein
MAKIEVGTALSEALASVTPSWRKAWGALALAVVLAGASQYLARAQLVGARGLVLLVSVLSITATVMIRGAIYRLALKRDHPADPDYQPGATGLQWRDFEWRILGATLVVNLIVGAACIAVFVVWGALMGLMSASHLIDLSAIGDLARNDPDSWAAFARALFSVPGLAGLAVLVAGLVGAFYLAARFSLTAIAYAESRRFNLKAAWSLTRGANFAIMMIWIVVTVGCAVLSIIAAVFGGVVSGVTGAHSGTLWGAALGGMATAALGTPAFVGLTTYIYRTQRSRGPAVAELFG